jgi:hypothetical protein
MHNDMTQRIKELLDSDFSAASALGEEIRRRVSSGDFEWATLLGAELARRAAREGEDSSEHTFLLDRLQTALAATSGQRSLRALMCLPSSLPAEGPAQIRAERRLAQLVALGQRPEDIVSVVYDEEPGIAASDEFKACLLHELEAALVLRGLEGLSAGPGAKGERCYDWAGALLPVTLSSRDSGHRTRHCGRPLRQPARSGRPQERVAARRDTIERPPRPQDGRGGRSGIGGDALTTAEARASTCLYVCLERATTEGISVMGRRPTSRCARPTKPDRIGVRTP